MSTVIFVDDEVYKTQEYVSGLQQRGIDVLIARSLSHAHRSIASDHRR